MKRILIVFAIISALFVGYRLIHPGVSDKKRREDTQEKWQNAPRLGLASLGFSNLISDAVFSQKKKLTATEMNRLQEILVLWSKWLQTGQYDSFIAFRQPQIFSFNKKQVSFVSTELFGGPLTLERKTDQEKAKTLYEWFNTLRMESLSSNSLTIEIDVSIDSKKASRIGQLNPFSYYPMGVLQLGASTPFGYINKPQDVLYKHKQLKWASCKGAFYSQQTGDSAVPVQVVLYWSPDDSRWMPYECYLTCTAKPGQTEREPVLYF